MSGTIRRSTLVSRVLCLLWVGAASSCGVVVDADGDGYAVETGDCDDTSPSIHPGGLETCDGRDEDCNGQADDVGLEAAASAPRWYADADGDGYGDPASAVAACNAPVGYVADDRDCDDRNAAISPATAWHPDCDGDGFGDAVQAVAACTPPEGALLDGSDCDDSRADVNPAASEEKWGDGIDNDCDGVSDADLQVELEGNLPPEPDKPLYTSIQAAIDAAIDGQVITVGPGTWQETLRLRSRALVIVGRRGAQATILEAESNASTVIITDDLEDQHPVLSGFTLTGGTGTHGTDENGCGASQTLSWGGGICIARASPVLEHLVIEDNLSDNGGGIYMYASSARLTDVIVQRNSALGAIAGGGGIYLLSASPSLDHVIIRENQVDDGDAAGAQGSGGGLWIQNGAPSLSHVIVQGNAVNATIAQGGGLELQGTSPTLRHVVVAGNQAPGGSGGGLHVEGGTVSLADSIIAFNSAAGASNVFLDDAATIASDHDVFFDPADSGGGLMGMSVSSTDRVIDPGFLDDPNDGSSLDDDYHLQTGSPCIDAGADGDSDPDGSPVDVGAYGGTGAGSWDLDGDGYFVWWDPRTGYLESIDDSDDEDTSIHPQLSCEDELASRPQ